MVVRGLKFFKVMSEFYIGRVRFSFGFRFAVGGLFWFLLVSILYCSVFVRWVFFLGVDLFIVYWVFCF